MLEASLKVLIQWDKILLSKACLTKEEFSVGAKAISFIKIQEPPPRTKVPVSLAKATSSNKQLY
jgi:hypothetical protein